MNKLSQWMKTAKMTKPLKFCAREENVFHQSDDFDNLHWIETKESIREILPDICVLQKDITADEKHALVMHCKGNMAQPYFGCEHVNR